MKKSVEWTAELDEQIRTLSMKKGWSFAEISRHLREKFGIDCSKNAVLGRASRIGIRASLAGAPKSKHKASERDRERTKLEAERLQKRLNVELPTKITGPTPVPEFGPAPDTAIRLLDALGNHCRFPVEGRGLSLLVCGAPPKEGSSYCPSCHERSVEPAPLRVLRPGRDNSQVPMGGKLRNAAPRDLTAMFR